MVNGEQRAFADGLTLEGILGELGIAFDGVAVALNDSVVPRGSFAQCDVSEGDRIEIIRAVSGG